jgi:hypothetical protein
MKPVLLLASAVLIAASSVPALALDVLPNNSPGVVVTESQKQGPDSVEVRRGDSVAIYRHDPSFRVRRGGPRGDYE